MSTPTERRAAQIRLLQAAAAREKRIIRMVKQGKSYTEIGQSFDPPITKQRVQYIFKRATTK